MTTLGRSFEVTNIEIRQAPEGVTRNHVIRLFVAEWAEALKEHQLFQVTGFPVITERVTEDGRRYDWRIEMKP